LLTGYAHPTYAQSLAEFGTPLELSRCGGWILVREILRFCYRDELKIETIAAESVHCSKHLVPL